MPTAPVAHAALGPGHDFASLLAAFTQVAAGVEDAHRALVTTVEELVQERRRPEEGAEGSDVLAGVPACDGVITLESIERQAVLATLERCGGHRQRTAEALGIGVRTLGMKLRAWKAAGLVPAAT
jgi:DNA-binding NtrC family response regulator